MHFSERLCFLLELRESDMLADTMSLGDGTNMHMVERCIQTIVIVQEKGIKRCAEITPLLLAVPSKPINQQKHTSCTYLTIAFTARPHSDCTPFMVAKLGRNRHIIKRVDYGVRRVE